MNKLLDEQTIKQLNDIFSSIQNPITVNYFTKNDCENCSITEQLFNELSDISEKVEISTYNIDENPDLKNQYNVTDAPSYIILNQSNEPTGAVFYGVPAGHEFNTLITNITDAGHQEDPFENDVMDLISEIKKPIDIKVFVTVSCPHCPGAAINASRLAQLNPNIKASVYESQTFSDIAEKYEVSGVPKIVINETEDLLGNQPIEEFLRVIYSL